MRARWTGRGEGDQRQLGRGAPLPDGVPTGKVVRRLHQVHGCDVVAVVADGEQPPATCTAYRAPVEGGSFPDGDALVARDDRSALAVLTADCAPLALASPEGGFAAVHAGWRGLAAGVVEAAVAALRAWGASDVVAALGPCIGPCCYEFGPEEAAPLAARYGDAVLARTTWGTSALDLGAGVTAALRGAGVVQVERHGACTGCGPDAFSHRRRAEEQRQALLVWRT